MAIQPTSKERLLLHARSQIWNRGYSTVPLRDIARAAGVDVALIARYFGSKRGLFEATMLGAFDQPLFPPMTESELVEYCTALFVRAPRDEATPSLLRMLLINAHDEAIGPLVRSHHHTYVQKGLLDIIGDQSRAALFMAVMLGFSAAERSLYLDGIADHKTPAYQAQLRHMLASALAFKPAPL